MSNEITLSEVQEFIAGFWYHYDQGHFDELAVRIGDEMDYLSRSRLRQLPVRGSAGRRTARRRRDSRRG